MDRERASWDQSLSQLISSFGNQHFGMVENAFIRAVDNHGKEIARFSLSGDSTFNGMCSMKFAEVYRKDGTWKFRAIGEPYATDNFLELLKQY